MFLGEVFERFAAQSPVSVMARAAFEHALSADAVDTLFEEHPQRQDTRDLLFSQVVDRMAVVVCKVRPSLNAAETPHIVKSSAFVSQYTPGQMT